MLLIERALAESSLQDNHRDWLLLFAEGKSSADNKMVIVESKMNYILLS
jgi:hypothetical protein